MFCKGNFGSLELLEDCLVIRRSPIGGFILHGLVGEKRIPYSSINAVQFKRAGALAGYIQFTIAGGVESTKGLWASSTDENTLNFVNNEVFEKARDFIAKKIKEGRSPQIVAREGSSSADQLDKLASLLERGLITREEFDEQKSVLLGANSPKSLETATPKSEPSGDDDQMSAAGQRMQAAMDRAIEAAHESRGVGVTSVPQQPVFGRRTATQ